MPKKLFSNIFEKSLPTNNVKEYTAYEVWPNSMSYAVGDVLPTVEYIGGGVHPMSGKTVASTITSSLIEKVKIRSYKNTSDIDVIVRWGDGSTTALKDLTPSIASSDVTPPKELTEYTYECIHEYAVPDKVYTVKIYGKDYFGIQHLYTDFSGILCGCFGPHLPIASHLNNLAGFAGRCLRLFQVELSEYIQNAQIVSLANTFLDCYNLEYAIGFGRLCNNLHTIQQCFGSCSNMTFCDLRIPGNTITTPKKNPYKGAFSYCNKLAVDVLDLLPVNGFYGDEACFGGMFNTCPMLTCSDYDRLANMLWNNKHIKWIDDQVSSNALLDSFVECSAELRSHVPTSWGGTAPDSIINKSIEKELEETKVLLETTVSDLTVAKKQISRLQEHLGFV